MSVEAILTGGLSLAITAGIAFLTGFASEAMNGSFALDEQGDSARSLAEETEALNKALEQEAQTQHTASVQALAHAEAQRTLAVETVKARKALLEGAIAEQQKTNIQNRSFLAADPRMRQANNDFVDAKVQELKGLLALADQSLAQASKTVALRRGYFVDRGVKAATDPRSRIDLTYDQRRTRLDTQRDQMGETAYARERIKLDLQRATAVHALSASERKASDSGKALNATRRSGTAIDREAAQAQKKLQADLEGVIGRYDPARKAASDYADELERIAALEKAGKISPDDAGNYRAQASAGYLGKVIDWGSIAPQADDEKRLIEAAGAIDKIVQSIEDETAALRTLDPVQREMLAYRKQLADLSPQQQAAAEGRIRAALEEKAATEDIRHATEDAQRAKEQLARSAVDAFTAIAVGGQKASDVISRLAGSIASAAIEATLFGTGPMAALLGGAAVPSSGPAQSTAPDIASRTLSKSIGESIETSMDKVFGAKGSFGTTLKNAGLGYAAGGATGSRTGGAVGGMIGGEIGKQVLESALGSLGSFAGPIGAIAGGLLGGAIGGLLKKTPKASATVTGVEGTDLSVSGNTGSAKKRAAGLGGAVQDTVKDIAAALGGELASFAVSIGSYKDEIRVDTTGSGRTKGYTSSETANEARGLYNFRDDEASAIAFAAMDAIADGGIKGLSEKVQKALKSSPDLDKAMAEAFAVQEIETMLGGIASEMASQFKSLEAQAKERVRIATDYGFDVVAIEKKNSEDRAKLVDQILANRVGSLQSLLDDMKFGGLAEGSAVDRRNALLAQIATVREDAEAGKDGAADKLAAYLRQLLDLTEDAFGTAGSELASDRSLALTSGEAIIKAENDRLMAAQSAAGATTAALATANSIATEQTNLLGKATDTLDAILVALSSSQGGASVNTDLVARGR